MAGGLDYYERPRGKQADSSSRLRRPRPRAAAARPPLCVQLPAATMAWPTPSPPGLGAACRPTPAGADSSAAIRLGRVGPVPLTTAEIAPVEPGSYHVYHGCSFPAALSLGRFADYRPNIAPKGRLVLRSGGRPKAGPARPAPQPLWLGAAPTVLILGASRRISARASVVLAPRAAISLPSRIRSQISVGSP